MKAFLLRFWNQTGRKGLILALLVVVPVWTYFMSKQDGRLNLTVLYCAIALVAVLMLGEFISERITKWRTTRKR